MARLRLAYLSLLPLIIGSSLVSGLPIENQDERSFISRYLTEHVANEEVNDNVDKARELLAIEENRGMAANPKLIDTLRAFIYADMIHNHRHCNMIGFSVLEANGISLEHHAIPQDNDRLTKLIYKQYYRHANGCQQVYRTLFQMRRDKLVETGLISQLDNISNSIIQCTGITPFKQVQFIEALDRLVLTDELLICTTHKLLSMVSPLTVPNPYEILPQIRHFFKTAIYDPCERFNQIFHDVLIPYLLDSAAIPSRDQLDDSEWPIKLGMAQFRVCGSLLGSTRLTQPEK